MLTQKQEAFCTAYIETGNATESYRRAYKTTSDTIAAREGKRLMDNHKIATRLDELRAPVREKAQITLEQHLDDLKRLRDAAEASEKYAAAVSAEVSRGKASGLYVEKIDHGLQKNNPINDLIAALSGKTLDPK